MKKLFLFIKFHYLLILLISYGAFMIVFRATGGSFDCDEGIYGQVARESLSRSSIFSLYWNGQLWFEKPPLMIWLTMLSFKLFGISEFFSRIFSGVFGMLGAVMAYFLGREFFKSKLVGFYSGFVLLTTPLYIWSTRSNMMDTALTFFISVSMLSLWKAMYGNKKWLLLFWVAMGFAVMAKSVAGLLPLIMLMPTLLTLKKVSTILRNRHFYIGAALFFIIVSPWHIYISLLYGKLFWNEYIGYHIITRFIYPIHHTPWDENPFAYIEILFQRSGMWSLILIILAISFSKIFRYEKEKILFLGIWFISIISIFSLSVTKLPQYLMPLYIPFSLLIGGSLAIYQKTKSIFLLPVALASLLNLSPFFYFLMSDYGQAQLLIPKMLMYLFRPGDAVFIGIMVVSSAILGISYYSLSRIIRTDVALTMIIIMSIALPFTPQRGYFVKEIGIKLTELNKGLPLTLYLKDSGAIRMKEVVPFYLPLGSRVENYQEEDILLENGNVKNSDYCYFEKQFITDELINLSIHSNQKGIVVPCHRITNK